MVQRRTPRAGGQSTRVLYVDDGSGLRQVVADYLERLDDAVTVVTEPSATAGLARVAAESVDCIVSDHRMPGMDGIDFCRVIRDEYPTLPFILITGVATEAVVSTATEAGVSGYVEKGSGTDTYEQLQRQIHEAVTRGRGVPSDASP